MKMLQNLVIGVGSPSVRWWVWQLGHQHTRRVQPLFHSANLDKSGQSPCLVSCDIALAAR